MNIIDIKFCNDEVYELKKVALTSEDVERQIGSINYNGIYEKYREVKDENGVEKENIPYLCPIFYHYIFTNNTVPSPNELIDEYFKIYDNVFTPREDTIWYRGKNYKRIAIEARLLRTYPSLIRDFHFYLLLKEAKAFTKVIYSCNEDIAGRDIKIVHNGQEYIVSLMVQTKRSLFFKKRKNEIRHQYGDNEIQIKLDLKKAKTIGDFYVYDKSHIATLIRTIKAT